MLPIPDLAAADQETNLASIDSVEPQTPGSTRRKSPGAPDSPQPQTPTTEKRSTLGESQEVGTPSTPVNRNVDNEIIFKTPFVTPRMRMTKSAAKTR